jgi:integrase
MPTNPNEQPETSEPKRKKDRDGLYKRREYWHYELIIDGRKRSFTTETKDYNQAKKKRAQAVRDLAEGKAPNDSGRKRFERAADEYIEHREATVSAGTIRLEKERLKPLKRVIGNVMLKDIAPRTIKSYQAARAAEVSNRTVNLETKDDWLVAFLAAVVANDSGMRGVELRNLQLRNIDVDARKITIRRSKLASSERTVILTNDAYKAILRLIDRAEQLNATAPDHYLFPYKIRRGIGHDPSRPMKGCRTAWRKLTKADSPASGFMTSDTRSSPITPRWVRPCRL